MPQYTVLEMVQDVLNEGDMDTVSTWDETIESEQIGNLIKTVFYEYHASNLIPGHQELDNPTSATGNTYYTIPPAVGEIFWIKWDDGTSSRKDLIYLEPKQFIEKLDTSGTSIADPGSGVNLEFNVTTDPTYWTSFDDTYICIDSYDTTPPAVSELVMYVRLEPSITLADGTIPDVPNDGMASFLAEVKSRALLMLNQEVNPMVEMKRRELAAIASQRNWVTDGKVRTPNYGRKGKTSRRNNPLLSGN